MKAVTIEKPGADFRVVERPVLDPGPGQVRLKVAACGVCHSDQFVKEGQWPGVQYPRVTGHEVAGVVDALGAGVEGWAVGDRVGVGWHGDNCGVCEACRRGLFALCARLQITGFAFDGGYQQYMVTSVKGLARIPDALSFAEAGPLLCAGVTTYNSLRHTDAMPGDLVAVLGVGGLGHLAIQFARHSGFHVVAVSRGKDKVELALRLGAHRYLDTDTVNAAEELNKMGGAKVIVATAPSGKAISALVDGLGLNGTLLTIAGSFEPMAVSPVQLITNQRSLKGWSSGSSKDSEDTMNFCALTGIRPMIEEFALEDAAKGYERMISNKVRFRAVLVSR
ncbi:MAG TPA: alcohol dehydrogenase [Candidatus Acidoferrales bacterium]|nr:alcohol dehydrogenase [Candidatus Acidoferrales bacterium]HTT61615.1 alcohol dehydrogenase [Bryobacteraceae bacterium]